VVGETGIAKLPEPSQVQLRSGAKLSNAILMDWKDRFIAAYDVELQAFIDGVRAGQVGGPSAWDGFAAAVVTDAALEALRTGQRTAVSMPERPDFYVK